MPIFRVVLSVELPSEAAYLTNEYVKALLDDTLDLAIEQTSALKDAVARVTDVERVA